MLRKYLLRSDVVVVNSTANTLKLFVFSVRVSYAIVETIQTVLIANACIPVKIMVFS